MEPDCILRYTLNNKSTAELQKLLEMSAGILIGFATERAGLHHRNETRLDLKNFSSGVNLVPSRDLVSRWSRVITECLLGHSLRSWRWCNDWFGWREWDLRRYDTRSNPSQKWLWIGMKVLRQVETGHTLPCFHINKDKKNKAKLACLASEYQFQFCS